MLTLEQEELFNDNINLVGFTLKKFKVIRNIGNYIDTDDFYQVGCIGLAKAVKYFNPELGFEFSTYAVTMIYGEIRRAIRDANISVKFSRRTKEIANKIKKEQLNLKTPEEIMEKFKIGFGAAMDIIDYLKQKHVSLETKIEDSDKLTLKDMLSKNENMEDNIINKIDLERYLENLTDIQRKVIKLYLKGYTQIEISNKIGVSQVHVSRTIKKSIKRIENMRNNIAEELPKKGGKVRREFRINNGKSKKEMFIELINNNTPKEEIIKKLEINPDSFNKYLKLYVS